MRKHLQDFMLCLKEERFYDAHEALEAAWFPRRFEENKEIKLLKGFINAAVSFELIKRGREKQSKKVWANYLKYRPFLFEIDSKYQNNYYQLSRLIETIQRLKEQDFNLALKWHNNTTLFFASQTEKAKTLQMP